MRSMMLATAIIVSGSTPSLRSVHADDFNNPSAIRFGATHIVEQKDESLSLVISNKTAASQASAPAVKAIAEPQVPVQIAAQPKSLLSNELQSPIEEAVPAPVANSLPQPPVPSLENRGPQPVPAIASSYSNRTMSYQTAPLLGGPMLLPSRPSGIGATLHYMQCDPYSCPGVWNGIEAQRAQELAHRCGSHGCGGVSMYDSACSPCGPTHHGRINRYRNTIAGCASCENNMSNPGGACDVDQGDPSAQPTVPHFDNVQAPVGPFQPDCPSCQAAAQAKQRSLSNTNVQKPLRR